MMHAWHFLPSDRRLQFGSREIVDVGRTITVDGPVVLCEHGLHASVDILDALSYAPGPVLCLVELGGEIVLGDNKLAATERTVLWMEDISDTLRLFARQCALDVAHLWDMPAAVRRYLEDGRADDRDAASDATWDPARDAAGAAARAAARAAAEAAAWAAAEAARAAAEAAAEAAAWAAARALQNTRLSALVMGLIAQAGTKEPT